MGQGSCINPRCPLPRGLLSCARYPASGISGPPLAELPARCTASGVSRSSPAELLGLERPACDADAALHQVVELGAA